MFRMVGEMSGEERDFIWARMAKTSIVLRDTIVKGSILVQITYMTRVIRMQGGRERTQAVAGPESEKKERKNKKSTNASTSVYLVAYVDY